MKKIFLSLSILFISVISCYAQDVSLIKNSNITVSELNSEQLEKYNKLKKSENFSEIWFIDISNLEEIQVKERIKISVPDRNNLCESAIFAKVTSRPKNSENYYWYGEMNGVEQNNTECRIGRVTIMAENGAIFGHLTIEDESYLIQDLEDGVRVLCKVNHEYYKTKTCPMGELEGLGEPEHKANVSTERSSATCTIKVLTLYTQGGMNRVANINQSIALALSQTNQAYANSAIGNNLELIPTGNFQINFTETQSMFADVATLATGNLFSTTGQTVNQLRNNLGADIVVMFGSRTSWAVGDLGVVADIGPNNNQAFGVFDALDATAAGLVFAHEVGHLFGARHEPCTAIEAGPNCDPTGPIQHAHVFKTGPSSNKKTRFTIMHSSEVSRIIPNYSNPNVTFDGGNTGTAARNNAQQHTNTSCTVAGFRPDNLPPLQVSISGYSSACPCNTVNLSIPNYTGITSIQWQTSTTGAFTSYGNVVSTSTSYIAKTPCTNGLKLFVKVTITASGGRSFSAYHTLTAITTHQCLPASKVKSNSSNHGFSCIPNPSSDRTLVNFSLEETTQGELSLFDANGRLIQNIMLQQSIEKGSHNIELSTENLVEGIYYLHLTTKDVAKVQKLIIIK